MAKKPTTDLAVKEKPGALASWEQEIADEAKADAAKYQQGVQRISFRNGNISLDGNKVPGNRLPVVVLGAVFSKAYYAEAYDPDVPQTPVCYAFHPTDQNAMKPHEAAPDKQHEQCTGCPHNAFGTAEVGKGKRCKDELRLMVVSPSDKGMENGELRMAVIPPGSLANWGKYVQRLRDINTTFRAVVTEVGTEAAKIAYKIVFNPLNKLTKEQYFAVRTREQSAVEQAMQPYPVLELTEAKPRKKNKKLD